ncbi:MAG: uL15 family ribosomal protein [Candidatus Pacebacteria bacterium]|nr:uL15 family ribosomal protein [Candidatus Paceibacterota bacterium]
MQLHELKRKIPNRSKATIGRGGKRGKTSGRGHKGQKAHGGHGIRPEMRDIIKRIPKLRGHGKNRARTVNSSKVKPTIVNLALLEKNLEKGFKITPATLIGAGLVKTHGGRTPVVKILGVRDIKKSFSVEKCLVSKTAKEKIEKAGGTIV